MNEMNIIKKALDKGPILVEHDKKYLACSSFWLTFDDFNVFSSYLTEPRGIHFRDSKQPDLYTIWSLEDFIESESYFYYSKSNARFIQPFPIPDEKLVEIKSYLDEKEEPEILYCLLTKHKSRAALIDFTLYNEFLEDLKNYNSPDTQIYIFPGKIINDVTKALVVSYNFKI